MGLSADSEANNENGQLGGQVTRGAYTAAGLVALGRILPVNK